MPDYDFRTLDDHDFEILVRDVLNAERGLSLRSYPAGPDEGIDLLDERPDGYRIVVQCKHYLRTDRSKLIRKVKEEKENFDRINADQYIFATSHPMNQQTEGEIAHILGIPREDVLGPGEINRILGNERKVERDHFKLWLASTNILESIIVQKSWHRSYAELRSIAARAKLWVEMPEYAEVIGILDTAGVCIVTGSPGVGKTFLAETIALQNAKAGGEVFVGYLRDLDDAWHLLRPDHSPQFFVLMDPLGEVDLYPTADEYAPSLMGFIRDISERPPSENKRLIVTSPTEVLARAREYGGKSLRELVSADRPICPTCNVSPDMWGRELRRRLVLAHLQFAGVPEECRAEIGNDRRFVSIVNHDSFNPRLIQTVCNQFTEKSTASEVLNAVMAVLDNPEVVWENSWNKLPDGADRLLLALATLSPRPVTVEELRVFENDSMSAKEWNKAIRYLEPVWIKSYGPAEDRFVSLASPALRVFLLDRLNNIAMANEWLDKRPSLEQLSEISHASGSLIADARFPPPKFRPALASVLRKRQDQISDRVVQLCEDEVLKGDLLSSLRSLRRAVEIIQVYGAARHAEWVIGELNSLLIRGEPVPVRAGLALGARIKQLSQAEQTQKALNNLLSRVISNLKDLDDLDSIEDYATELDLRLEDSRSAAEDIILAELDRLGDESDPDVIRTEARRLHDRATMYGIGSDVIDGVMELANEIENSLFSE
ncbi:restriction endonuclease [Nocardia wallacei]|uniref:nSTAND3 domain-containing NTPase n=1 Tax=Nocardia wallacei TaxID=480035 RepID=UPI00245886F3|nr:restriction endonuclease [Nocardia wallacei]